MSAHHVALLTVGHGRLDSAQLVALLHGAGVTALVDIRRYPGSRAHPDMARDSMATWLPEAGIGYRWEERLGGRRTVPAGSLPAGSLPADPWWKVAGFRGYAAHTRTAEFTQALDELLGQAVAPSVVAIMCAESMWWRCHRRVVADVAVLARGVSVRHLMPNGAQVEHRPAAGARLLPDGNLVWDRPADSPS